METKAAMTRRQKSNSLKQKKRRKQKITFWVAILAILLSVGAFLGWAYVNKQVGAQAVAQYETVDQQKYLKTTIPAKTAAKIKTDQARWDWLLLARVRRQAQTFTKDYQARKRRGKALSALKDGTSYYRNNVTNVKLTRLDKQLLQEKNQTVYQKQKNELDTIQVWFAQTNDGATFIQTVYQTFQKDKNQLTQEKVSEAKVYYRLLRNRKIKKQWEKPIEEMSSAYTALEKTKSQTQAAEDQQALNDLKNAPLTQSYTPAQVTINSGSSDDSDNDASSASSSNSLTKSLNALGITASRVLVLDDSEDTLFMAARSNGSYSVSGSRYNVLANGLSKGSYRIRALIQDPSSGAGVITSGSQTGTYFTTAPSAYADDTNTDSDFNSADPVFWLKNQPGLASSILVSSGSTLGFITSDSVSSSHIVRVSSTGLSAIMGSVSTSTTLCVI